MEQAEKQGGKKQWRSACRKAESSAGWRPNSGSSTTGATTATYRIMPGERTISEISMPAWFCAESPQVELIWL